MKVVHVVPVLTSGGAESLVAGLGAELSALGVDVLVYLLAGVRYERGQLLLDSLRGAGVDVEGVYDRHPASPSNILHLRRIIRSWRPDIVHAHLYSSEVACMCAKTLSLDRRVRFVRTIHSTAICGHRRPRVVRLLGHCYDLTVACSEPVADAYRLFMGVDSVTHLSIVPNGAVMLDAVPDMEAKLRTRHALNIPERAFVVAHIGRLHGTRRRSSLESEPKAQDVLLNAFAKAFRGDAYAALILVGDGNLRGEAEQLAEALGVTNQVRFLNRQPEPWPALTAADLFCFPSRYEGLPLALLEAASCGLPIVASDIPEIRGLSPGDAWTLAPVDDVSRFAGAMVHVRANLGSYVMRAEAAAPGFREKYSMRDCAKRHLAVYQAVLEGRHSVE